MVVDSIAQINNIPQGQLCQAFDPMVILPNKAADLGISSLEVNTSCVAPAYVYLSGSRGSRFLCDFHYVYEKDITICRTPDQWPQIERFIIDNRLVIDKTFPSSTTNITVGQPCWCGLQSYVNCEFIENGQMFYFCNFHYRKTYYRFLSNGTRYEDMYNIVDERDKMPYNSIEESNLLKII